MSTTKKSRRRLYGFILFNVIEETIIAIIAFVILLVFFHSLLVPGMINNWSSPVYSCENLLVLVQCNYSSV